jgi:hypothetical protein
LLFELEAKRRSLPFGDAADAGPTDARGVLEFVDADARDASGAEGEVGDRPDGEVALERMVPPERQIPCRRQRLVDARSGCLDREVTGELAAPAASVNV